MLKNATTGYAMIEVLISMGIIATVFLYLLSYEIAVYRQINQSRLQAIAHMQLINLVEMLRVNQDDAFQKKIVREWKRENAQLLPNSHGELSQVDDHECDVSIKWIYHHKQHEQVDVWC